MHMLSHGHAVIWTCCHMDMLSHAHAHTHTRIHACYMRAYMCIHAYMHACMRARINTCIQAQDTMRVTPQIGRNM